MKNYVFFMLCFVLTIVTVSALRCYHCISDKVDGCKKSNKLAELPCGHPAPTFESACSYKVLYEPTQRLYRVNAGCETIPIGSPMDKRSLNNCEIDKGNFDVKECRVCNTDLCNSATTSRTHLITIVFFSIFHYYL